MDFNVIVDGLRFGIAGGHRTAPLALDGALQRHFYNLSHAGVSNGSEERYQQQEPVVSLTTAKVKEPKFLRG